MQRNRLKALTIAVLGLVGLLATRGSAETSLKYFKTKHFVVVVRADDLDGGKIEMENLKRVGSYLEMCHERLVEEMGFRSPSEGTDKSKHTIVAIYAMKESQRTWNWAGVLSGDTRAFAEGNTIHLRLDTWGVASNFIESANEYKDFLWEIPHEYFHCVQSAYDPPAGTDNTKIGKQHFLAQRWIGESTAQWAADAVFPKLGITEPQWREKLFLKHTHYPIHYLNEKNEATGHPYGASVLVRYFARHHGGHAFIKKLLEAGEAEAKDSEKHQPLEVLAKALGTSGANDSRFREIYDRFVTAAIFRHEAPSHKLVDVKEFRRFPNVTSDLLWSALYMGKAQTPEDTLYRFESGVLTTVKGAFKPTGDCWLGAGGFRAFHLRMSTDYVREKLPENTTLEVVVEANKDDLSVRGYVRYGANGPLSMIDGVYNAKDKLYRVRFPRLEDFGDVHHESEAFDGAYVVLTRYGDTPMVDHYPVTVTLAEPPVLSRVKLSQVGSTVFERQWKESRTADGLLTGRQVETLHKKGIDKEKGEARIELVFSRRVVQVDGKPLCSFGDKEIALSSEDEGKTWKGKIESAWITEDEQQLTVLAERRPKGTQNRPNAASKLVLPLDIKPETLALPLRDTWKNYERDGKGMVIRLPRAKEPIYDVYRGKLAFEGSHAGKQIISDHETWDGKPIVIVIDQETENNFVKGKPYLQAATVVIDSLKKEVNGEMRLLLRVGKNFKGVPEKDPVAFWRSSRGGLYAEAGFLKDIERGTRSISGQLVVMDRSGKQRAPYSVSAELVKQMFTAEEYREIIHKTFMEYEPAKRK